ncbi:hypothetical protein FHX48_001350 [Microbacterium halimionae]|uniref:Uncharacterized protein n=1 Tax=Microbacterium halimionae TaxID=1526413 RepID=A0A7W3JNU1_9MICO|nr:hypothetical protein [Microbacterium halimionae]NII96480.1 hypothetical protein [Microbacterium halimionae]
MNVKKGPHLIIEVLTLFRAITPRSEPSVTVP